MNFVIHYHSTENDHYDFMFEKNDALLTWRIGLDDYRKMLNGEPASAVKIQDHDRKYLNYQGPVSCGRGHVKLIDSGKYKEISNNNFFLHGDIVSGNLAIETGNEGIDSFTLTPAAGSDYE
jgi:hypothetical protein